MSTTMKIILTILLLFPLTLKATDTNKLDILGLHLGDDLNSSLNKIPCNANIQSNMAGDQTKFVYQYYASCKNDSMRYDAQFDHNEKVISISRSLFFTSAPDINSIKQKLLGKYGKPDSQGKSKNEVRIEENLCWGTTCEEIPIRDNPYWTGISANCNEKGQCLVVELSDMPRCGGNNNLWCVIFTLKDYDAIEENNQWVQKTEKQKGSNFAL